MCVCVLIYPFGSQHRVYSTFDLNFEFKIRKEHRKKNPATRICHL